MKLPNWMTRFNRDQSGAVTVDWVVLTAAIVGLGLIVASTVSDGVKSAAAKISEDIATQGAGTED